jgi:hypothetical protein
VLRLAETTARLVQLYDADSDDGKRVRADEKLAAFIELEAAIRAGVR